MVELISVVTIMTYQKKYYDTLKGSLPKLESYKRRVKKGSKLEDRLVDLEVKINKFLLKHKPMDVILAV